MTDVLKKYLLVLYFQSVGDVLKKYLLIFTLQSVRDVLEKYLLFLYFAVCEKCYLPVT